jgi:hypothetical protein
MKTETLKFLSAGSLGIYSDFLYTLFDPKVPAAYKVGAFMERASGPTIGPLLELGVVNPLDAIHRHFEGKETFLLAKEGQVLKGWFPLQNVWYAKAALDHLIFNQVFEAMSPGYLTSMRRRTERDYNQSWWYEPGELLPERLPDLGAAVEK